MLARREHSRLELEKKLKQKDFCTSDIKDAVELLIKQNYQSDIRFADLFVKMRISQGKGSMLISQQLKQKGIEGFDLSDFDFFTLAKTVRIKKYGEKLPKNYQEKAKQMRFLQSRGFGFDEIKFAFE